MLVAYGLRGSTGFGGALGMPLLALVIPIKILIPVWTLLGFASSVAILGRERRHIAYHACTVFVPWCLVGIAAGLYLFKALDPHHLARALGLMIMIYAAHTLWTTVRPKVDRRWLRRAVSPVASILCGAVGTLFGTMGSVFMAMHLDARGLVKSEFRATMSAMLLTLSTARGIGYYAVGEFTEEVWLVFAAVFPLMLIGVWIGDRIQIGISDLAFRRLVAITLFLCGFPLLLR